MSEWKYTPPFLYETILIPLIGTHTATDNDKLDEWDRTG